MTTPVNPDSLPTSTAWSQAVLVPAGSQLLFIGGQNAVRDGAVIDADAPEQTRVALGNVLACVQQVGGSAADLVSLEIRIVAGVDVRACAAASAEVLGGVRPAISVSLVAGLVVPGALVEISGVAAVDDISEASWLGRGEAFAQADPTWF